MRPVTEEPPTQTIRQQFRRTGPAGPTREFLHRTTHFLALSVGKARDDHLAQQAAALAFTTLISLVPLLAAFSSYGVRWFEGQEMGTVGLLSELLPYSEDTVLAQLRTFVDQAQSVRGIGFAFFLFTSLMVFTTIEKTINTIWQVPAHRALTQRLTSLAMVLFCGPLLIAAPHYLLFQMRRNAPNGWAESLSANLLPFATTLLGLTLLYTLVPYTKVHLRHALVGALLTTLVLEGLRWGFRIYVANATNISVIYGSFGLALFFMISIQLTWYVVLLGSEVTYCLQHFDLMSRERQQVAPVEGSWLSLAALAFITQSFRNGQPVVPYSQLASHLRLEARQVRRALDPVLEAGILQEMRGKSEGYLLARDPHDLELSEIFRLYEPLQWEMIEPQEGETSNALEDLRVHLTQARRRVTQGLTLADLVSTAEGSAPQDKALEDSTTTGGKEEGAEEAPQKAARKRSGRKKGSSTTRAGATRRQ